MFSGRFGCGVFTILALTLLSPARLHAHTHTEDDQAARTASRTTVTRQERHDFLEGRVSRRVTCGETRIGERIAESLEVLLSADCRR